MASHETFHYSSLSELRQTAESLGVHIPVSEDTSVLGTPLSVGAARLPNRLGIAPMEGADALPDGSPSELTLRRYLRQAEGGAGIIWFEAISVAPEGRSSAHQLMLTDANLDAYKRMIHAVREAGMRQNGYAPYLIMQANHSGRYSNPEGAPRPLIAYRHPYYEALRPATDANIVTDEYLRSLPPVFEHAALLAREAGFDAVDIKSCHGYLFAELTSAYLRVGEYGGSYENRTRLLKQSILAAKTYERADFAITSRLGIYDGYPYPYGFGVREGGDATPVMEEPIRLVRELHEELGLSFIGLTMGNPYVSTHVTRPYDRGNYPPPEHPLEGIARMIDGIGQIKRAVPGMTVLASAPTYLRQYADAYTAGAICEGLCDGMLFGRMAFAAPDFANRMLREGGMDKSAVCITCGKCGELIRAGRPTGCVIRDGEVYLPHYREYLAAKAAKGDTK